MHVGGAVFINSLEYLVFLRHSYKTLMLELKLQVILFIGQMLSFNFFTSFQAVSSHPVHTKVNLLAQLSAGGHLHVLYKKRPIPVGHRLVQVTAWYLEHS